jgi:hypothetical protein
MNDDPIDEAQLDEFEIAHPEVALDVRKALDEAPRLSPAATRFMSGATGEDEARRLGYLPSDGLD